MKYSDLYKIGIYDSIFGVLLSLMSIEETNLSDSEVDSDGG